MRVRVFKMYVPRVACSACWFGGWFVFCVSRVRRVSSMPYCAGACCRVVRRVLRAVLVVFSCVACGRVVFGVCCVSCCRAAVAKSQNRPQNWTLLPKLAWNAPRHLCCHHAFNSRRPVRLMFKYGSPVCGRTPKVGPGSVDL